MGNELTDFMEWRLYIEIVAKACGKGTLVPRHTYDMNMCTNHLSI